jgi:hypothetical protein
MAKRKARSPTTKNQKMCKWHATYRWKVLNKGYKFALDLTSIGDLHNKLWPSNNPNFGNFRTLKLGILGQNDIWMYPPWLITKNTIRRKVVPSPKSGLWWVLWIRVCPWLIRVSKVFQLCINQLVIWFV